MSLNQSVKFAVALCFTTCCSLMGCAPQDASRAAVEGTVRLGSQPMAAGRILFLPLDAKGSVISAVIKDGKYKVQAKEGVAVGRNRVEIEADLPLGFALDDDVAYATLGGQTLPPNPVPLQFNRHSTLTAVVQAKIVNKADFMLPLEP